MAMSSKNFELPNILTMEGFQELSSWSINQLHGLLLLNDHLIVNWTTACTWTNLLSEPMDFDEERAADVVHPLERLQALHLVETCARCGKGSVVLCRQPVPIAQLHRFRYFITWVQPHKMVLHLQPLIVT